MSLDLKCCVEADECAPNDDSPVKVSVTDDEGCGQNESKSNSSPSSEKGNTKLFGPRELVTDKYSKKEASSEDDPEHPFLSLFVLRGKQVEGEGEQNNGGGKESDDTDDP